VLDDLQEILAESLQVVELKPPLLAEPLAEGFETPFPLVDEDRAHQFEALLGREPVAALDEVVVEPHRAGLVLEDQGRAHGVLGEAVGPKRAGVLQALEDLELAEGGPLDLLTVVGGRLGPHVIEPHAPGDVGEPDVGREPVLVSRAIADDLLQLVVADRPLLDRGADAGLLHRLADELRHRPVERPAREFVEPGALPALDRGEDSGASRPDFSASSR